MFKHPTDPPKYTHHMGIPASNIYGIIFEYPEFHQLDHLARLLKPLLMPTTLSLSLAMVWLLLRVNIQSLIWLIFSERRKKCQL